MRICDRDAPQSMSRKSCYAFSILTCSKALILNDSYRSNESLGMGFRLIEFDLEIAFQERGFGAHPMELIESRLYAGRQFIRLMNVNIDGKNINAALKDRNLQNHLGLPHLCAAPQEIEPLPASSTLRLLFATLTCRRARRNGLSVRVVQRIPGRPGSFQTNSHFRAPLS